MFRSLSAPISSASALTFPADEANCRRFAFRPADCRRSVFRLAADRKIFFLSPCCRRRPVAEARNSSRRRPVAPTTHLRPAWCGERGRRRPATDADANALLPKPTLPPCRHCSPLVWPFPSSQPSLPRRLLLSSWPSRSPGRHPLMSLSHLILWSRSAGLLSRRGCPGNLESTLS